MKTTSIKKKKRFASILQIT